MGPQLTLTVHPNGQGVVLSVGGEVDLATAPQLRAKLVDLGDGGAGSVVVDLTRSPSWTRPASACSWARTGARKRVAAASGLSALPGRCFASCG